VCRHRSATALNLLGYDGQGFGRRLQRLAQGRCPGWPPPPDARVPRAARELSLGRWHGNPAGAPMAPAWRRVASGAARRRAYAPGRHAAGSAKPSPRGSCRATRDSTALPPA
jgi:hypothetical protein